MLRLFPTVAAGLFWSSLCAGLAQAQIEPAVWLDVPFVHQPQEGCGAASLSMLMEYWAQREGEEAGPESEVEKIQTLLYSRKEHGIAAGSMTQYLEQHGYRASAFDGSWNDLDAHLRKGQPLIVALKPEGQSQPHYVVIDGIDPGRQRVTMNDPVERKLLTQDRAEFERDWGAAHHWVLLAVPLSPTR